MRASDVPGSWRLFLYASALCGCSNVYHCCWLPRLLRCLSIVYQIFMLIIYIIVIGVALADPGPGRSLDLAFNRYADLLFYIMMVLSNIVILWQTLCGSGSFLLFQTQKKFQAGSSYAVKHRTWPGVIMIIACLLAMMCELILIGTITWLVINERNIAAVYIFPVLKGHNTLEFMFGLYVLIQLSAMTSLCFHVLFCFVVLVDIMLLFLALRKQMDVVFSSLIVDDIAVERCLRTMCGICELVDTANGTFGAPLAIYLMWIVPTIINSGLQLLLRNEFSFVIYGLMFGYAIVIFVSILVPPAVMTAQVKDIP